MNRIIKRFNVTLLILALAFGTILTGCGSKSSGGSSGSVKLFYSCGELDDFKTVLHDALIESATSEGVTLDIGEPCKTVNDQVEQLKQASTQGYDAIICLPIDRATCLQLEAVTNGLPIVFVNVQPDKDYLQANKYICVGSYEMNAGAYQAEYVWNALGNPTTLNAIIMRGELTHNAAIQRSVSVKDFFKKNGVTVNYVFDDTANWSDTEASNAFKVFLKTGQSVDAVFCNNDTMALGVIQAMKDEGIDYKKIPVVGVDATAAGCESIVNGEMQFTVYQSAKGQGESAIKSAKAILGEGTIKNIEGATEDCMYVWVPFEKVDASNVKDYQ
ncbi:MAG: substrate-binding domain-containing protein [Pseudobutyrivibrio sp.]|nr:substrate-binding domain-containing protein [Pseudobutyrivibrio sp.]